KGTMNGVDLFCEALLIVWHIRAMTRRLPPYRI
ncbi:MAG: hypothetical protein K0R53_1217, partial [Burkholderiales bacterium]|nr:hypothetical protein [Burkholderiales bacterium]